MLQMVSHQTFKPTRQGPSTYKKTDKQYIEKLDYSGIEFPVNVKQVNKIEKQNKINISVFGYEEKQPFPIYVSKEKFEDHMELLLITKDEKQALYPHKRFQTHSCSIKQNTNIGNTFVCTACNVFSSDRVLNNYKDNCIQVNGTQAIKMPTKDNNILKFNNFHKQQPVPFVIYADFEAITEKVQGCQPDSNKSYTEAYQRHTDCGYGYKLVCCYDDKYTKPEQIYRGENAVLSIHGKYVRRS